MDRRITGCRSVADWLRVLDGWEDYWLQVGCLCLVEWVWMDGVSLTNWLSVA